MKPLKPATVAKRLEALRARHRADLEEFNRTWQRFYTEFHAVRSRCSHEGTTIAFGPELGGYRCTVCGDCWEEKGK